MDDAWWQRSPTESQVSDTQSWTHLILTIYDPCCQESESSAESEEEGEDPSPWLSLWQPFNPWHASQVDGLLLLLPPRFWLAIESLLEGWSDWPEMVDPNFYLWSTFVEQSYVAYYHFHLSCRSLFLDLTVRLMCMWILWGFSRSTFSLQRLLLNHIFGATQEPPGK